MQRPKCALSIVCVALLGVLGTANAQSTNNDYPVERFRLATNALGVLDVESGDVPNHLEFDMAMWVGFADDPLNLYRSENGERTRVGSLVSGRLGGSLVGSFGLYDRFQLGLSVPLILSQQQDLGGMPENATSFGLGDLRLIPKVRLLRQDKAPVALSLMLGFTVPTSTSSDFMGDSGAVFQPEIAVSRNFSSGLRTALNLGYRMRGQTNVLDLVVDDELFGHVGVGYRFSDTGGPPLEIDLTFALATGADDIFGAFNRNYAETKIGGSYDISGPLILFAAAGVGVAEGFGTPDWRVLAGVRFQKRAEAKAPAPKPIIRVVKKELDRDKDGILDKDDACPLKPENKNGYKDADGCPETIPDTDNDGLDDLKDKCPKQAEDDDDFEDEDGCPDTDNDKDGMLDTVDACPMKPGPKENKGCPDTDRDGDTVVDRKDNCPDQPGSVDNHGCKKKQLVVISKGKIDLLQKVFFRTNRAIIRPRSYKLLNNVAQVLKAHTEIAKVRVEGHTDDRGRDAYNLGLSRRRAKAVVKYLVRKGVAANRLEAVGFGETKPIKSNDTKEGRAANRRVDFKILGDTKGEIRKKNDGPTKDTIDN